MHLFVVYFFTFSHWYFIFYFFNFPSSGFSIYGFRASRVSFSRKLVFIFHFWNDTISGSGGGTDHDVKYASCVLSLTTSSLHGAFVLSVPS